MYAPERVSLCEALDLHFGERVLDVAAGNGNASLAAARRWCDVTSTDYVGSLLDDGAKRAEAAGSLCSGTVTGPVSCTSAA